MGETHKHSFQHKSPQGCILRDFGISLEGPGRVFCLILLYFYIFVEVVFLRASESMTLAGLGETGRDWPAPRTEAEL